jgi:hypothetical protein
MSSFLHIIQCYITFSSSSTQTKKTGSVFVSHLAVFANKLTTGLDPEQLNPVHIPHTLLPYGSF